MTLTPSATSPTVGQRLADFLKRIHNMRAAHTARAYTAAMRKFVEFLKDNQVSVGAPASRLTMARFIAFPAWLAAHTDSKRTALVYSAAAKALLDFLLIEGHVEPSYSDVARYDRARKDLNAKREEKLVRVPSSRAIQKILAQARQMPTKSPQRERDIALVEFLASTGCRIDEAAKLKVGDVSLSDKQALVTGKGSKERLVYLSTKAVKALGGYWRKRGPVQKSQPAFARHDRLAQKRDEPLPVSTVSLRKTIEWVAAMAGVDGFHPHLFRHAFGSTMLEATGDLALVQDLLGHASPASTRIYAKVSKKKVRQAHQKVWR